MNRKTAKPKIKTKIPGPKTKKWVNFHMKFAAETTYHKHFVWDRKAPATGPYCTDPDGNIFLDFASHVASNPLGYNHPKLTKVAQKLAAIEPDRYAGTDFISAYGKDPKKMQLPTPSHLHHKIAEITKSLGLSTSFFINSGAEAVENAIKICFMARPKAKHAVVFQKGFHGRTLGALSMSSSKSIHNEGIPQIPNVIRLPYLSCKGDTCHFYKPGNDPTTSISALISHKPTKAQLKPSDVAYILVEPIQGEGGYNFPNPMWVKEIQETAKKYGIPLICDEIQTGMGRTGTWWASEQIGFQPDLITIGKALRIGAVAGKKELFPQVPGRLGSTWGESNAIASAMGYLTIDIIQKENLLEKVQTLGKYFLDELKTYKKQHKSVEDVRGMGLLLVMEFQTAKQRDKVAENCLKKGLLLIGCGEKSLRFLPPLNVKKREINQALEILETCLKPLP